MRFFLPQLLLPIFLVIGSTLFSQSRKPLIAQPPSWVTVNKLDYSQTSLEKYAVDGLIDLDYEQQVSLQDQSEYFSRSIKVISEAGVQNGSEVSVSFDPSYQQLIFHSIHILRDNKAENRLQLSNIKIIQQEKELNNFIYNGSLNAVLFLDDVRKGDIIEYSYTIKGFNPIFKNKFTDEFSTGFSSPIYQFYYKIIVPPGRKLNIKTLNDTLQPNTSVANGGQVYEWRKNNITPTHVQDYTPSWYDPFPQVLISEFNSWKEVNDWALELFPVNKELSAPLKNKIAAIEATCKTDEAKVQAALRFVQDDIRYMGIEMGVHSHKPADPSKIFAQRFGDCKEKSYMLCCMLRAMHITANPVLINTTGKNALFNWLPAPTDFDHTTVRVTLDNQDYWFDPTISYQRGSIKELYYPDYQAGLVITDTTANLTAINFRNTGYEHVKEMFSVKGMAGAGKLLVTTSYKGYFADDVRSSFNNNSNAEMMNSYQKFYVTYYEQIKIDSLNYTDDDSTGLFTTTEYYTLPDFWTLHKGNIKKFSFTPFVIGSNLRNPKEKDRKMPFRLPLPGLYKEEIVIDLPENWQVAESKMNFKNASCGYSSKFYNLGSRVYVQAEYENYKDYVSVEDAHRYLSDLKDYDDKESYELTYGLEGTVSDSSSTSSKNIILTVVLIGAFVGGVTWWSQRKQW